MDKISNLKGHLDWTETALIALLVCAIGFAMGSVWSRPQNSHLQAFAEQYGPSNHSQYGEEWLIRDFFQSKRHGVFLDVGANHHRLFSNTYYLETVLGWSGVAVEPQTQFAAGYAEHRPRTRFRPFFVSDSSDQQARLYVVKHNPLVSSADKRFAETWGEGKAEAITAPTITLNDLLAVEKIDRIDFMNMDIETWEPKALAGFDIQRFRPSLVCIEAHPEVTQEIVEYFTRHQYVLVSKYLRADEHNLYFTTVQHSTDMRAAGVDRPLGSVHHHH